MQDLLLLHGAIGAKDQLEGLAITLQPHYNVYTLNFSGHGGEPLSEDFTIQSFVSNVQGYMEAKKITSANIFGYSMGGYVGMYLARHFPAKVLKLVTLATKFYWDVDGRMQSCAFFNLRYVLTVSSIVTILSRSPSITRHSATIWL